MRANLIAASTASVPGITEKHLAGPRHPLHEALGEKPCQQRDIELDKTGEAGVEHLSQGSTTVG